VLFRSKRRQREPTIVSPLELLSRERPLLRGSLHPGVALRITGGNNGEPIAPIRIDPTEFAQIALNVAVNANDAMPGGGELTFEVSTVVLHSVSSSGDAPPPGRWTLIRAIDSGSGMPPDVLAQAFEPFFTTKEEDKGTGLGLATVRTIVLSAGGYIKVSSTIGRGTEFRFYFPAVAEDAGSAALAGGM